MFIKETVTYQGSLYWIYRKLLLKEVNQKYHDTINILLSPWNCDVVLRSNTNEEEPYFIFLRKIDEAKIEPITEVTT